MEQLNYKKIENSITNFLNTQYRDFSNYTVAERAIPSLCDGLKPGARKIVNAMFEGSLKNGKTFKLLSLVGDTMKLSLYAHGDSSLISTVCTLAKDFYNFYNPLEIEGQGGILRSPEAGAARYLYIRKSKWADLIYKTDYDLLDFKIDEGQKVEPVKYLPIIPNVLSNLNMGIANGYSFHAMSWHPIDIIDSCTELLTDGCISTNIHPYLRDIKECNWKYIGDKWYCFGEWKINQSTDTLLITDLPCDTTYVDFEKLLNKLCETGFIKDYIDLSEDGKVKYEIKFQKKQLSSLCKQHKGELNLVNRFKLIKQVPDDLLWVLDENNKLTYFDNKYKLIEYFVTWRLSIYGERKKKLVKILEERYKDNSDLVRFIELVCKGKLKIRNRSKADIKVDMDAYDLPINLISTPMSKCTIEERDELLKQNEEIKKELEYIKTTTTKQMYLNDLAELKKNIEKDFPEEKYVNKNIDILIEAETAKPDENSEPVRRKRRTKAEMEELRKLQEQRAKLKAKKKK